MLGSLSIIENGPLDRIAGKDVDSPTSSSVAFAVDSSDV